MKKRIHINQHTIKSNIKNNKSDPVITVKTYKSNHYADEVDIGGPCSIIIVLINHYLVVLQYGLKQMHLLKYIDLLDQEL